MARNDRELLDLLADGPGRAPHRGRRSTWPRLVAALRHVADGQAVGKVLVQVAPPG